MDANVAARDELGEAWFELRKELHRATYATLGIPRESLSRREALRDHLRKTFPALVHPANSGDAIGHHSDPGLQLLELVSLLQEDLADRILFGMQGMLTDLCGAAGIPLRDHPAPAIAIAQLEEGNLRKDQTLRWGLAANGRERVAWTPCWNNAGWKCDPFIKNRSGWSAEVTKLPRPEPGSLVAILVTPSAASATNALQAEFVRRLGEWSLRNERSSIRLISKVLGWGAIGLPCHWVVLPNRAPCDWVLLEPEIDASGSKVPWPTEGKWTLHLEVEESVTDLEFFPAAMLLMQFERKGDAVFDRPDRSEILAPSGTTLGESVSKTPELKWKTDKDAPVSLGMMLEFREGARQLPREQILALAARDLRTRGVLVTTSDWRHGIGVLLRGYEDDVGFDIRPGFEWGVEPGPAVDVLVWAKRRDEPGPDLRVGTQATLLRAGRLLQERLPRSAPLGISVRIHLCWPVPGSKQATGPRLENWPNALWEFLPETGGLSEDGAEAFLARMGGEEGLQETWDWLERVAAVQTEQAPPGRGIFFVPVPEAT